MRRIRALAPCAALAAMLALVAAPAQALKVATWNLTLYTQSAANARAPYLRTVLAGLSPDLLIVQEMDDAPSRDSLLDNVLNVVEPGQWSASSWFVLQPSPVVEGGAIFYKPSKVAVSNVTPLVTGGPRKVLACLVKPVGYVAASSQLRLYSVHFKAGNPTTTPGDSATRRTECTSLRNTLNAAPAGTNLLLGGDTNFYGDWEGGYIRLTESQANNNGRLDDPVIMTGTWHTNFTYRFNDSQCPCNTGCPAGFSGGGLDDRFDFFMSSYGMQDGAGLDVVPGTLFPYGNDGLHFNDDVNGSGFNNAVGITIANALHEASDHLPTVITLQVPAKVLAASQLDFGPAIVGGTATQTLSVSNSALAPADVLSYALAAPADFTAPGGSFVANAGAAANDHVLGMTTATPGAKSGTLTIASDDPDSASKGIRLSGTVLRHAVASLDSGTVVADSVLDLGEHAAGATPDSMVRVHDQGWDALQARLAVTDGTITGGEGRFTIAGGFSPATLAGVAGTWNVHFDDTGATADSTYEATLTFTTADEPLPGATPQSPLTVTLRARVTGNVGVRPEALPTALRFYAPRPNPLSSQVTFAFDLPSEAPVSLEVFDLAGRRVTSLVSGFTPAGRRELRWDAVGDRGARVPAGIYIARFATPGLARSARIVVLP